jgi:hypothetical protein
MVVLPLVVVEGWAKDGPKFAYRVNGCDVFYITKYNLVQHLRVRHNVIMELGFKVVHLFGRKAQGIKIMRP